MTLSRLRRSSISMKSRHDDAAEIAQANLADDFLDGFEVGLDDGVFQARRAAADVLAGVDVDGHQRFGVVDDDVAAGLEPHLGAQGLVEFLLDAEFLEDRRGLGVELDAVDQLGLEAADEFDDLAELLFVVDPDGGVVVAQVIAQDALDQVEVAMQQRRRFARLGLRANLFPGAAEEFHVAANFFFRRAFRGGANDESAREGNLGIADDAAQTRALFGRADAPRDADVVYRRHVDEKAARQSDVTGDARALFAQRLLGDLNENFLPGLEHLGDQLHAALLRPMASSAVLLAPGHGTTATLLAAAAPHRALEARALRVGDARGHWTLGRG